jgi:hypothetical protein
MNRAGVRLDTRKYLFDIERIAMRLILLVAGKCSATI